MAESKTDSAEFKKAVIAVRKGAERMILTFSVGPGGLQKSKNLKKEAEENAKEKLKKVEKITKDFIKEMKESSSGAWTKKVESVANKTADKFKNVSF